MNRLPIITADGPPEDAVECSLIDLVKHPERVAVPFGVADAFADWENQVVANMRPGDELAS